MKRYIREDYRFPFEHGTDGLNIVSNGVYEEIDRDFLSFEYYLPISKEGLYPYQLYMLNSLNEIYEEGRGTEILETIIEKKYEKDFMKEMGILIEKGLIEEVEKDYYKLTDKGLSEINDPDNKYIKIMNSTHCIMPVEAMALYLASFKAKNITIRSHEEMCLTLGYGRVEIALEEEFVLSAFEELLHLAEVAMSIDRYGSACLYMAKAIKILLSYSISFKEEIEGKETQETDVTDTWDSVIEWRKDDVRDIMLKIRNKMDDSMVLDLVLFHMRDYELPEEMHDIIPYDEHHSEIMELIGIEE